MKFWRIALLAVISLLLVWSGARVPIVRAQDEAGPAPVCPLSKDQTKKQSKRSRSSHRFSKWTGASIATAKSIRSPRTGATRAIRFRKFQPPTAPPSLRYGGS